MGRVVPVISSSRTFDGLGPAGGVLAGQYPNPDFAQPMATTNDVAQKADVVHTHPASSVSSGVLSIERLPVSTVSSATALVRSDDARLSDARPWNQVTTTAPTAGQVPTWNGSKYAPVTPPTAQTVAEATTTSKGVIQLAGDLSGIASAPRVVLRGPIGGHKPASATGGAVTIDASTGVSFYITATTNLTFNPPTNPSDAQRLVLEVVASGATRSVTVATAITSASGVPRTVNIAADKVGFVEVTYSLRASRWILERLLAEF